MTEKCCPSPSPSSGGGCCPKPQEASAPPCCCPTSNIDKSVLEKLESWQPNSNELSHNDAIPSVDTKLNWKNRFGAWKARWGINRMHYTIEPGLYAFGEPTQESNVYISANYRMSFNRLRSALDGTSGWILVLDTKGINVWCAAGKGTFGTDELVDRIKSTKLSAVVSHRNLIVPQLGATGVSAYEVKKRSGFSVIFGPVRAPDLPEFIAAGMKASREMRTVRFPLVERLVLIPIELVGAARYLLPILALFVALSGFGVGIYSLHRAVTTGYVAVFFLLVGYLSGTALTPLLLPWLPGRAFAAKGAWAGIFSILVLMIITYPNSILFGSMIGLVSWILLIGSISSFLGMNFTGASTYASPSGVRREMRYAIPLQMIGAVIGTGLWIVDRFI